MTDPRVLVGPGPFTHTLAGLDAFWAGLCALPESARPAAFAAAPLDPADVFYLESRALDRRLASGHLEDSAGAFACAAGCGVAGATLDPSYHPALATDRRNP